MFKNPLRKYQQGGAAPTADQQKLLAAFIEWLPKRVKEFQGMQPEQIAQALDGMTKTPEGQKQVQQLMQQFQQELQQSSAPAFRNGGKIHDFVCKHAKGGMIDCGCGGGSFRKMDEGGSFWYKLANTTPIGRFIHWWNSPEQRAERNEVSLPYPDIERRNVGYYFDPSTGVQYLHESGDKDGNSFETRITVPSPGDTNVFQKVGIKDFKELSGDDKESVIRRNASAFPPKKQIGGKVEKAQDGFPKLPKPIKQTVTDNFSQGKRDITRWIMGNDTTIFIPMGSSKKRLDEILILHSGKNGPTERYEWYGPKYKEFNQSKSKKTPLEFWNDWNKSIDNKLNK